MSIFRNYVAESVSDGHPDKIADQLSDAVVDVLLAQDPHARIAVEALIKDQNVVLAGEISGNIQAVDWDELVRDVLSEVGHSTGAWGLDLNKINVTTFLSQQSPDIASGVSRDDDIGAGDQGMMYGYACNDTDEYMPLAMSCAQRMMRTHKSYRATQPLMGPDAKCQVTLRHSDDGCVIDNIVFSTQHSADISLIDLRDMVVEDIIKPSLSTVCLDNVEYIINPAGLFISGGPVADCGVTGRKIIVDTYGSAVPHGGGAFSGKDPTKVDRSAAYMARYIAKNYVHEKHASEAMVILAYAIGSSEPVLAQLITEEGPMGDRYIRDNFDITPRGIIKTLDLNHPIYRQTASLGHMGRNDLDLPWERLRAC